MNGAGQKVHSLAIDPLSTSVARAEVEPLGFCLTGIPSASQSRLHYSVPRICILSVKVQNVSRSEVSWMI